MAKTKDDASNAVATVKAVSVGETISSKEMGAILNKLTANPENEITADYLKLEVGQVARIYFLEMTEIKSIKEGAADGETSPAIRFVDEEGAFGINADAVIVSTCSKLKKPTPLEISCTGTGGNGTRKYKTFKIIELS